MNDTFRISFKSLQHAGLREIFTSLQRATENLHIDFYLIGALARDTWFAGKGIRALGTKDIDIAVMVTTEDIYRKLKDFLISKEHFTESSSNEYVLFDQNHHQIDLLPFGSVEIEGKKVIDNKGIVHTGVTGFKEVFEHSTEAVNFEDEFTFKVSTLAGIVILKLIAYDDRPEMRGKDIADIAVIVQHYYDFESDLIFENYMELLAEDKKTEFIGARVLGRQIKKVLENNIVLRDRVLAVLRTLAQGQEQNSIRTRFLRGNIENLEEVIALIDEIINGIEE